MNDLNLSPWGVRVYWTSFALLLVYVCLGAFSGTSVPGMFRGMLATVGLGSPKWTIAALFFPALILAYSAAALFDYCAKRSVESRPASDSSMT